MKKFIAVFSFLFLILLFQSINSEDSFLVSESYIPDYCHLTNIFSSLGDSSLNLKSGSDENSPQYFRGSSFTATSSSHPKLIATVSRQIFAPESSSRLKINFKKSNKYLDLISIKKERAPPHLYSNI